MRRAAVIVACAVAAFGAAQPSGGRLSEKNDEKLAAVLEPIRARHKFPALGGAIVTSEGLSAMAVTGVRKYGSDVAASPADLWHLGSDTKAMTAGWIATVVSAGKLTWESTIGAVLPQETADAPGAFRDITLRQLLSHRAGLPANIDWQKASRAADTPRGQRLVAAQMAAKVALSSTPGSKYQYLQPRVRARRNDGREGGGPGVGGRDPDDNLHAARHDVGWIRRTRHARAN